MPVGHVTGFDVRTGKRLWIFHTIPRAGQPGYDTWTPDAQAFTGNAGVWAPISADAERGLVYLPVEAPTSDFYGGHRPGDNLFSSSLVCLDARTGERRWHFQLVHHDIWDYDTPAAPVLLDITVEGPAHPRGRAGDQAGPHLRLRSRERQAGLADRRAARAEERRAW